MARIKLKLGDNEIEVDSRDFYVDNKTIGEVIDGISNHLPESSAKIVYEPAPAKPAGDAYGLGKLDDAEAFEPEFAEPRHIDPDEIRSKLRILETSSFFDKPHTVTETVEQLREYGWAASPLDVSKELARMASNREIVRNSVENLTQYVR
ncbi:MAG: hypothetical protein D9C04_04745 [Nitrosopumilus sp. B06]|nr:MAG: hypothetical protein EB828_06675 [Nitrosopumilus sp. D6]RNJ79520.1 MAG: hypothetical protein D9C04_04745 [Nitrosopumilus sp. B06]